MHALTARSVRAPRSHPLMCLQAPGPGHRRGPRLTGTLDRKMNSLEGHLRQLPAAGQRRRRTHDPAVAASAPELGAVARQADQAAGEDDAAWWLITASTSHHCTARLGLLRSGGTLGLPCPALRSTLIQKEAAPDAVPGLEWHALPTDTSPAASKTRWKLHACILLSMRQALFAAT